MWQRTAFHSALSTMHSALFQLVVEGELVLPVGLFFVGDGTDEVFGPRLEAGAQVFEDFFRRGNI